jgi:peptide/nickel transport system ATP-binding protein
MPYTLGLLGSLPRLDTDGREPLRPIPGTPPSLLSLGAGCPFAPRCPLAYDRCVTSEPELDGAASHAYGHGHLAACHRSAEFARGERDLFRPAPAEEKPAEVVPLAVLKEKIVAVDGLVKHFPVRGGRLIRHTIAEAHAVCGVSFDLRERETLGLVGESGCGKSTTARTMLQLLRATSGSVRYRGEELTERSRRELRSVREELQVVFQDPYASLDPRMPVGEIVAEPLRVHGRWDRRRGPERVNELFSLVGLNPEHRNRYPHEFSGGQRQRVGIARALALGPKVMVLDEPVSALDVSIQAGIVNLLAGLRDRLGLAYLFIAHDLSVIRHISDRVAVMYLGKIVETGTRAQVYDTPSHPYTQALMSAVPVPDPVLERQRRRILLTGDVPSAIAPPSGCRFRTRCWKAQDICAAEEPVLTDRGQEHPVACHFAEAARVVPSRQS